MASIVTQKSFAGTQLKSPSTKYAIRWFLPVTLGYSFSSRTRPSLLITASSKTKTDLTKVGLNSVQDPVVKKNLMGYSDTMKDKNWTDPQGRKGKVSLFCYRISHSFCQGFGVYRFANKYGANVDGYSPIYSPDTWSASGSEYKLGKRGIVAWLGLLVILLAVGVNLVISTSQLGT